MATGAHVQGKQVLSIQYFRVLAALMVVAHHGREKLPWLIEKYPYKLGEAGVDIFFVISGFVMVYITHCSPASSTQFMRGRIARIVPLYWVATLALAALLLLKPTISNTGELSLSHLVLSLLFVPHTNAANLPGTFLVVGWTLQYEMFFYVVFAGALLVAGHRYRGALTAVIISAIVLAGALLQPEGRLVRVMMDEIMLEFVFGMLLAGLFLAGALASIPVPICVSLIALGLAGIVIGVTLVPAPLSLVVGVPAAIAVMGGLALEQQGRVRRLGFVLLLADASYAIYLFNLAGVGSLNASWKMLGLPTAGWMTCLAFVGLSVLAGAAVGCAVHLAVERPLMRFSRRKKVKAISVPARLGASVT